MCVHAGYADNRFILGPTLDRCVSNMCGIVSNRTCGSKIPVTPLIDWSCI